MRIDFRHRCSVHALIATVFTTLFVPVFISVFIAPKALAQQIEIDQRYLSPSTLPAVERLVRDVESSLPHLLLKRLGQHKPMLFFRTLTKKNLAAGHKGKELTLASELLVDIVDTRMHQRPLAEWAFIRKVVRAARPPKKADAELQLPRHPNVYTYLKALVIHELAHAYEAASNLPISTQPDFLHLIGLPETGFVSGSPTRLNDLEVRSPDPLEYQSPREAFAVNLEYFLLDPEYQCRRPALYQYLSRHFAFQPFTPASCHPTSSVLINGLWSSGEKMRWEDLDESRLYAIHYLHASEGPKIMSWWGHTMLHLVFCDPKRLKPGPECLKDTAYHRIANFEAAMDDMKADLMKGLTGSYPAILFLVPFELKLQKYHREFRDLYSLPLRLSEQQKKRLYQAILENHWNYRSKYYFLENNCATEVFNLIKTALYESRFVLGLHIIRPDSLFEKLMDIRVGDGRVFNDLRAAARNGYFFPSPRKKYEAALAHLKRAGFLKTNDTLEEYMNSRALFRMGAIQKAMQNIEDPELLKTLGHLERTIRLQKLRDLEEAAVPSWLDELDRPRSQMHDPTLDVPILRFVTRSSVMPWIYAQNPNQFSYGIPSVDEAARIRKDFHARWAPARMDQLHAKMTKELPLFTNRVLVAEIQETAYNEKQIAAHLLRINDYNLRMTYGANTSQNQP